MKPLNPTYSYKDPVAELLKINKKQLLLGIIFLFAGTLEYFVNRPIATTFFLWQISSFYLFFHNMPYLPKSVGAVAPDFFHSLAFSLLSMALFSSRKSRIALCFSWLCLESAFELGQKFGMQLANYLPEWLETVPVLRHLKKFFMYGRFDVHDIIAIGLGCLTAFIIGEITSIKGGCNDEVCAKKYLSA